MAELNLRRASQRCNRTFGESAAAYHEREVRQPLPVGRQPPAERVVPPPWRQPPAEREVQQPQREVHGEILQCSDCRQFKVYACFYKPMHTWTKTARRCMECHDDHHWVGAPVPIHEQDAVPASSGAQPERAVPASSAVPAPSGAQPERSPWADQTDSA